MTYDLIMTESDFTILDAQGKCHSEWSLSRRDITRSFMYELTHKYGFQNWSPHYDKRKNITHIAFKREADLIAFKREYLALKVVIGKYADMAHRIKEETGYEIHDSRVLDKYDAICLNFFYPVVIDFGDEKSLAHFLLRWQEQ